MPPDECIPVLQGCPHPPAPSPTKRLPCTQIAEPSSICWVSPPLTPKILEELEIFKVPQDWGFRRLKDFQLVPIRFVYTPQPPKEAGEPDSKVRVQVLAFGIREGMAKLVTAKRKTRSERLLFGSTSKWSRKYRHSWA